MPSRWLSKMRSTLSTIFSPAPFHLLAYGSLLGTQLYQSFVMTGLTYRALPIAQFRTLQKRVFPAYFNLQLLLVAVVAVTHPPHSIASLVQHRYDSVLVGTMLATSALNWVVYGPRTLLAMVAQTHQETRDGRKSSDLVKSDGMKAAMRQFSKSHAMSVHVNLITIVATVWYGFVLASKISFESG